MSEWVRTPSSVDGIDLPPSPARAEARRPSSVDPFERVNTLGDRAIRAGGIAGLVVGLLLHGTAPARAMTSLYDMLKATQYNRHVLHEYFWATYEIDTSKKDEPKEKEPEPEPPPPEPELPAEPKPVPQPAKLDKEKDPYEPPPTPAQAAKVLTKQEDPNEKIEDMTNSIVNGEGTATHGLQSAQGTGDKPVTNPAASLQGKPGGVGTGAPQAGPPAASGPDRTKTPGLVGGSSWNCPFPPEADTDQVDEAVATITVTVRPDGTPAAVSVVADPGHGFGRAARMCAMSRRFTPGLDRSGTPILQTTPPIKVRFTR